MSMFSFFLGFVSAFGAIAALVFYAGAKGRPFLAARIAALQEERRTTRAKAVKMAASVDKFKITSIEAVRISSTPAHISTAGVPCRLAMIGGAITLSTAYALAKQKRQAQSPATEAPTPQDRAIASISAKNVTCTFDPHDRSILHIAPKEASGTIAEVADTVNGETKQVKWRAVTLRFEGGAREADRWYTALNPKPSTERWITFTKSLPDGARTSFNMFVARILFENSAETTLDDFIAAKIRKKLSHVSLPPPLAGSLELIDLHFGDESPFFMDPSFAGLAGTGEFGMDFNLLYRGGLTLLLSVTIQIGPVKVPNLVLEIKIAKLQGKLHVSIGGPPSNKMWVGFHEAPELNIDLKQDVQLPADLGFVASAIRGIDISEIVSEVVKVKLFEDMILPSMDDLPIPDLGPTPPSSPTTPTVTPAAKPPQLSDWSDSTAQKPAKTAEDPALAAAKADLQEHLDTGKGTSTAEPPSSEPAAASDTKSASKPDERTASKPAEKSDITASPSAPAAVPAKSPRPAATAEAATARRPAAADAEEDSKPPPVGTAPEAPTSSPEAAAEKPRVAAASAADSPAPAGTAPEGAVDDEGDDEKAAKIVAEAAERLIDKAHGVKDRLRDILRHVRDSDDDADDIAPASNGAAPSDQVDAPLDTDEQPQASTASKPEPQSAAPTQPATPPALPAVQPAAQPATQPAAQQPAAQQPAAQQPAAQQPAAQQPAVNEVPSYQRPRYNPQSQPQW